MLRSSTTRAVHQTPDHTYTIGERVRLVRDCLDARIGDEGTVVAVFRPLQDAAAVLVLTLARALASSRMIAVFTYEIEPVRDSTQPSLSPKGTELVRPPY